MEKWCENDARDRESILWFWDSANNGEIPCKRFNVKLFVWLAADLIFQLLKFNKLLIKEFLSWCKFQPQDLCPWTPALDASWKKLCFTAEDRSWQANSILAQARSLWLFGRLWQCLEHWLVNFLPWRLFLLEDLRLKKISTKLHAITTLLKMSQSQWMHWFLAFQ